MLGSFRAAVFKVRQDRSLYFASLLSEESILEAFGSARWLWQGWVYTPVVTVWVFLSQCLSMDHSCREAVARLIAWRVARGLRPCSADTGAYCKLSGLVTEAGGKWTEAALKPYVEVLLQAFGPARLMWGSDWPVVNEAGGYAAWHSAAWALAERCTQDERDLIFGGAAQAFYGIAA